MEDLYYPQFLLGSSIVIRGQSVGERLKCFELPNPKLRPRYFLKRSFSAANFGEVSGVDRAGSAELDLAFAQGKQELFVPIEHSPTIPKTQISQGS